MLSDAVGTKEPDVCVDQSLPCPLSMVFAHWADKFIT